MSKKSSEPKRASCRCPACGKVIQYLTIEREVLTSEQASVIGDNVVSIDHMNYVGLANPDHFGYASCPECDERFEQVTGPKTLVQFFRDNPVKKQVSQ